MEHHFNLDFATKYGVNEAIFCHNLYFWIKKNQANNRHYYEGRYWTYNSMDAFTKLFPYWSLKQIRTVIANCEKKGLIVKGNFNKSSYDRTSWYAVTELVFEVYEPNSQMDNCMCPNGQMEMTEQANPNDELDKPIPYNKPDNKQHIKNLLINKEEKTLTKSKFNVMLIDSCNSFYNEFAPGRWTKQAWVTLIDKFVEETMENDTYKRVPADKVKSYAYSSIKSMARKYDVKNGKVEVSSSGEVPFYDWLNE